MRWGHSSNPSISSRLRAAVACLALISAPILTIKSAGASPPQDICAAPAPGGSGDVAASAALTGAAAQVENILQGPAGPARDVALRGALAAPIAARGVSSASAVAAYCVAAGEAERLTPQGSPYIAQALLRRGLKNAEDASDAGLAARAAYRLGLAALSIGETSTGARAGEAAPLVLTRSSMERQGDATCDALLAGATATRRAGADDALQCAATRAVSAGDSELSARARLRLARLRLTAAQTSSVLGPQLTDLAATTALAAMPVAAQTPAPLRRADLLGRLIEVAIEARRGSDPAVAAALAQMEVAASGDPAAGAFAAALRGRLADERKDTAGAIGAYQRAVFLESQRSQPVRLSDWFLLLADADSSQRVRHVNAAYQALESVRPTLPQRDPVTEESMFSLHMRPVFEAAAEAALPGGVTVDAAGIANAQRVVEAYRQAEIQSVFGNECVPPLQPVKPRDLRVGESVLYPILLKNRVELLYAVGGEAGGYQRLAPQENVSRDAVAALVNELVASTRVRSGDGWRAPAAKLYDLLIRPIEGRLSPDTTLIIMPDGPLRAVPFGALLAGDGPDGRPVFLVQKTRLAVAPALSYAQVGSERAGATARVVAASLQREITTQGLVFEPLKNVEAEVDAATPRGSAGVALKNFTRAELEDQLARGRVDVLHLATHAAFNGGTERTFIVANGAEATAAIPLADLRRMIARSRARGDELDLLILSACETAVGDDQASMGLAGAAVQAGARSAIASLWKVDDTSTKDLISTFYESYRAGASKAQALQAAQRALIDRGGAFAHPHFWSAFALIGGWR